MLQLKNISFERCEKPIFANISMDLSPGELLQIEGNNGSGKTTLLRVLGGLLKPSQGAIFWSNKNIAEYPQDYQANFLYLGHHNAIKEHLTLQENLALIQAIAKKNCQNSLEASLKRMNLPKHGELAKNLSLGQKRRLGLARLFFLSAPLWILDEPLTGLDYQGKEIVETLISEHLMKQGMVILSTHQKMALTTNFKKINLS